MRRLALLVLLALAACSSIGTPPRHGQHEILNHHVSGFWTSNAPAVGGAYKYNLMFVGLGVFAIMLFFVLRLIRRANAERRSRS